MAALGKISYHKKWELTEKRRAALERLAELGVDVYSSLNEVNYTLLIPHNLIAPQYIEIGYLIAQLGDEVFPEMYNCLSDGDSKVFPRRVAHSPVYFVDSHPHGMKYRIRPTEKENSNQT